MKITVEGALTNEPVELLADLIFELLAKDFSPDMGAMEHDAKMKRVTITVPL